MTEKRLSERMRDRLWDKVQIGDFLFEVESLESEVKRLRERVEYLEGCADER